MVGPKRKDINSFLKIHQIQEILALYLINKEELNINLNLQMQKLN